MSDFEQFWNTYDNKKSRDKVERKWHTMSATDRIACMESLPAYIKETPDRQYRKHPATYLNQKSWNDKLYKKGEEERLYKTPKPKEVSKEPAKYFDPEDGKKFIIGKIKSAYEGAIQLNDIGEVYSNRLRDHLDHPPLIIEAIEKEVKELSERKPSNRFEEFEEINYELEVRNRILRFNLKSWQESKRQIYKEL